MNQKIICIGAHKTATTSLFKALQLMDYKCCSLKEWYYNPQYKSQFFAGNHNRMYQLLNQDYQVYKDSPFNYNSIYQDIYKKYPDALYILTIRDVDSWGASFLRWKDIVKLSPQWLRYGYGTMPTIQSIAGMKKRYTRRNEEVIKFFKENGGKLLVIDLEKEEQPWTILGNFLNKNPPAVPFPHVNRTKGIKNVPTQKRVSIRTRPKKSFSIRRRPLMRIQSRY